MLRVEERLARGSLARDRNRTTLTLGSLVIGLAMIVALGWAAQAARASAFEWLDDVVPGDEIVTSIRPVGPDEPVREALAGVPGVASVTPIASFDVAYRGMRVDAAAIVGRDFFIDDRLTAVAGDRVAALEALDEGGSVIVPVALAERLGLHLGDVMTVPVDASHTIDLKIAAIVERSMPGIRWRGHPRRLARRDRVAGRARRRCLRRPLRARPRDGRPCRPSRDGPDLRPRVQPDRADPGLGRRGAVAASSGCSTRLALVAVIVAALGIVNTLTMGVVERVREIGVLRAIGMSRRQVMRMVVVEATVLGIVGVVLGSLAGMGAGAVLLQLGGGLGDAERRADRGRSRSPRCSGWCCPAVASIYPALAASRVSIVEALHFD